MHRCSLFIAAILMGFAPKGLHAQDSINDPNEVQQGNQLLCKAAMITSAYYAGSMYVLSKTWYKDRRSVPFHFYNDNAAYLQVDKFGHAFGAYAYSYIGFHFLLNAGYSRKDALFFGASLGVILQTPIEIMDGLYEGYGFSWGDMMANIAGSALVFGQELAFNKQVAKFKFSYWESSYANKANGLLGESSIDRLLKDYNGHTYWLSAPLCQILPAAKTPGWLSIAFGYSANGMYGEFVNVSSYLGADIPSANRYRQFLFSLDIDWTRIQTHSGFLKMVLHGLTFVKLPFPAIEFNPGSGLKTHLMYY